MRTEKRCPRCGETKPIESFRFVRSLDKRKGKPRNQPHSYCRPCESSYLAEWALVRNRELGLRWRQEGHDRRKYGLERGGRQALIDKQQGLCAICQEPRKLVVDHDHKSGLVRAMLCNRCNTLVGHEEGTPGLLDRVRTYAHRWY